MPGQQANLSGGRMEQEEPKGAAYYWEQAARLVARANLAPTPELRVELLRLAHRWERLAIKAATAEQTVQTLVNRSPENVSELEIYRAANQLIRRHPRDADAEAARRSRQAYDLGDMFNFHRWARIARAAMELGRRTFRGHARN